MTQVQHPAAWHGARLNRWTGRYAVKWCGTDSPSLTILCRLAGFQVGQSDRTCRRGHHDDAGTTMTRAGSTTVPAGRLGRALALVGVRAALAPARPMQATCTVVPAPAAIASTEREMVIARAKGCPFLARHERAYPKRLKAKRPIIEGSSPSARAVCRSSVSPVGVDSGTRIGPRGLRPSGSGPAHARKPGQTANRFAALSTNGSSTICGRCPTGPRRRRRPEAHMHRMRPRNEPSFVLAGPRPANSTISNWHLWCSRSCVRSGAQNRSAAT